MIRDECDEYWKRPKNAANQHLRNDAVATPRSLSCKEGEQSRAQLYVYMRIMFHHISRIGQCTNVEECMWWDVLGCSCHFAVV